MMPAPRTRRSALLLALAATCLASCASTRSEREAVATGPSGAAQKPAGEAAASPAPAAPSGLPKYGPGTVPLSRDHGYFRRHASPNFWSLIPYYVPQELNSCSAATMSMVLNSGNSSRALQSSDELVRQQEIVRRADHPLWKKAIESGDCLGLDSLAEVFRSVLKLYGYPDSTVEVVHFERNDRGERSALRAALAEAESRPGHYVIANFIQGKLTGDPEAMNSGHISPIGAYDAKKKRVLMLDVDRQWYEPYWVPEAKLFEAMNTIDAKYGKSRGFLRVRLGK